MWAKIRFPLYFIIFYVFVGVEAKKLYDEAQNMLNEIIANGSIKSKGIVAFYPANSVGDDIYVYESEPRTTPSAVLYGLRQQAETDPQAKYQCISDFIAPLDTGKSDYVGMFAVSSGFGCEELCAK